MSRPLVLYHGHCPDGFCAAWVAHRVLGDEADYRPVQYGQPAPGDHDIAGRDLFIVDFSYKRAELARMSQAAHSIVVLDHHKTAQEELCKNGLVNGRLSLFHNTTVHFDMAKSGGRLAWEHLCTDPLSSWANCPVPWLVDYTEDRDLWRWKLDWSKEISAFISSHPFDFRLWDDWAQTGPGYERWDTFVDQGAAILRYKDQVIKDAVANAVEIELAGHKVKAVNTTVCFSEVAGELAKDRPFGAAYFIRADGRKQWSLRSRDGGVDVSEVAKRFGGGGHRQAAGFEESAP